MGKKIIFRQQDYHKKVKIRDRWKRPRGLHSKMRLKRRGYRKSVSVGYRTAKKERGLHGSGLCMIRVSSLDDLKGVSKGMGGVLSGKIGLKKRIEILKNAEKEGITILDTDVKKFLKEAEVLLKTREEKKKERAKDKTKKKEEKEKAAKKKEEKTLEKEVEKEEGKMEEGKKEEEKKEKDRILTKKEM